MMDAIKSMRWTHMLCCGLFSVLLPVSISAASEALSPHGKDILVNIGRWANQMGKMPKPEAAPQPSETSCAAGWGPDTGKVQAYRGECKNGTAEGVGELWSRSSDGKLAYYTVGRFKNGLAEGNVLMMVTERPADYKRAVLYIGGMVGGATSGEATFWVNGGYERYEGGVKPHYVLDGFGKTSVDAPSNGCCIEMEIRDEKIVRARSVLPRRVSELTFQNWDSNGLPKWNWGKEEKVSTPPPPYNPAARSATLVNPPVAVPPPPPPLTTSAMTATLLGPNDISAEATRLLTTFDSLKNQPGVPKYKRPAKPAQPSCGAFSPPGVIMESYRGGCRDGQADGMGESWWRTKDGKTFYIVAEYLAGRETGKVLFFGLRSPKSDPLPVAILGQARNGDFYGEATRWQADRVRYQGAVDKNGTPQGQGESILPDGGRFIGQFVNGQPTRGRVSLIGGGWDEVVCNARGCSAVGGNAQTPEAAGLCKPGTFVDFSDSTGGSWTQAKVLRLVNGKCEVSWDTGYGNLTSVVGVNQLREHDYTYRPSGSIGASSFDGYLKGQAEIDRKRLDQGSTGSRPALVCFTDSWGKVVCR